MKKGTEERDRVVTEADLGVVGVQRKGTEDSRAGAKATKRQQDSPQSGADVRLPEP